MVRPVDVINWLSNYSMEIILGVWSILFMINMYSNHKNEKSNRLLMDSIKKSNDLNNKMLSTVKEYADSTDGKITIGDRILWQSILILANRIHDLEDHRYV